MQDNIHKKLLRVNLGRTRYKDAWEIQKQIVSLRAEKRIPDCLLVTEHEPVITMGRATQSKNLLCSRDYLQEHGIDLFSIERGGDITFHGPGQLIVYPIIDLSERGRDLHKYLRDLEKTTISALDDLGLAAEVKKGLTGVWVNDQKIAAIGVAVSRWVTYHGLALNVNTDLDYFKLINPCGITEYPVGSVSGQLGKEFDFSAMADLMATHFARVFECDLETVDDIDTILAESTVV